MKKLKSSIKKILFTGGGGVGNELMWRILKKKYKIYFCDFRIDNINTIIPKKNVFRVPLVTDKKYINSVKKICDKYKIDIIVPGIDEELVIFKKNKYLFKSIFLPSIKMINICNDKWSFYQECIKRKINIPTTSLASKTQFKKHKKIVILKPRFGRGSKGIIICKNHKIAKIYLKILSIENKISDYIVQDYVKGSEYTVTQCFHGKSYLYPLLVKDKKGITINAKTLNDRTVNDFCKKISEIYKNEKIYNIQLIKVKNKCYIIEINPRISTTFCFFIANGLDPFSDNYKLKKNLRFNFLNRHINNFIK